MNFKNYLCILACFCVFAFNVNAQSRQRIVKTQESQPTNTPVSTNNVKRPTLSTPTTNPALTNQINVAKPNPQPLVKKIVSSQPTNIAANNSAFNNRLIYTSAFSQNLLDAMTDRLGIPYRYGSNGPNSYDCSSFVWSVFQQAGIAFERSSARNYWAKFEPVSGDDRYKFGTLVFFNNLGHMGIVADEKGFYHASVSKGITYSKFEGYWQKRIVGFRRVPVNQ